MERRVLALLRRMGFGYSCFKIYAPALHSASTAAAETLPVGCRYAEVSSTELMN